MRTEREIMERSEPCDLAIVPRRHDGSFSSTPNRIPAVLTRVFDERGRIRIPWEDLQTLAGIPIPDPHGAIVRHADNPTPVGRERHPLDDTFVSVEPCQLRTARGVPDPYGLIQRPAGDPSAVGRER